MGGKVLKLLKRLRHFRGHGVHSPYIYGIVRDVYMHEGLIDDASGELTNALLNIGCGAEVSTELQNTYSHCKYNSFAIDPTEECGAEFVICSERMDGTEVMDRYQRAKDSGASIVILEHNRNAEMRDLCAEIIKSHRSTIIEKRRYILIFNNHLPRQYFVL